MEQATATPLTAIIASTPLTQQDRCDRCGAAAYMRAVVVGTALHFCGHHARKHGAALLDQSQHVHAELDRLDREHGPLVRRDVSSPTGK